MTPTPKTIQIFLPGGSANGWAEWKTQARRTLAAVKRQNT